MATVKLTDVKKVYDGNVVAVHDFNLEIKDKEFVVFVGPSGCGKSTTLRMIAGLEDISGGTVEIDGEVVNDLQPKDRHVSMVFQNYALYPHLSVYENMAFPLRISKQERTVYVEQKKILKLERDIQDVEIALKNGEGDPAALAVKKEDALKEIEELKKAGTKVVYDKMSNDEIYARVVDAAKILGITPYLTRKPKALSGGQRQRVAIGRAMVRDSKVFLMDEPLSNLDAKLRNQMRAEIILLRQKINSTFVYVTHDQTEAMTLGDRIVIMKDGYIMQVGTPTEVFDRPENLFVAGFIGSPMMNTMKAELSVKDGKYSIKAFGVDFPVDGPKGEELTKKGVKAQPVILGVRPEHISLSNTGIPVTLIVNEMMGNEYHLHVQTGDGSELIVRVPTVDLSAEERAALVSGAKLHISFAAKVMHFFDPESEKNLLYGEGK
ncbi:MAG: ATP-binding cassette domain-containing protein [Bacillota bacterium]|nr:ATP-binding cassette domain-containing protein [Bacillota bacterium]